jgi:hypothetical protein
MAEEYVRKVGGQNPLKNPRLRDREEIERLQIWLMAMVRVGYEPFFRSFRSISEFVIDENPAWWFEHQQSPLYRYCVQALAGTRRGKKRA